MGCKGSEGCDRSQELTLSVTGMNCSHCQKAVEDALNNLNGIQDVQVDLEQGMVKLKYDPTVVSLPKLKAAIQEAGYEVL